MKRCNIIYKVNNYLIPFTYSILVEDVKHFLESTFLYGIRLALFVAEESAT